MEVKVTKDLSVLNDKKLELVFTQGKEISVLKVNGKVIGAYQLNEIPLGIEIRIGVVEDERRKGYGAFLTNEAYNKASELYSDINAVLIITDNNRASFKVAEKCGFIYDYSEKHEQCIFTKKIPPKKTFAK